jgi:hypothetical protein
MRSLQNLSQRSPRTLRLSLLVLISIATGCLSGCASDSQTGWHWGSVYREDIHSVAVPVFTSKDYRRGVESQLTDSLVKKIEEYTPYKVEPRDRADTVLEGEIVAITPSTLSLNPYTATPQEQEYSIIVNFTWKDLRTGKILLSRQGFEQATTYFPSLGEGQYVASENAVEKLALGIVNEMEGPW